MTSLSTTPQAQLRQIAATQGGFISREQAAAVGAHARIIKREADAGRLRLVGRSIEVIGAPPNDEALLRSTLVNGPDCVALDSISAMVRQGLKNFTTDQIHVSVPKGTRTDFGNGVKVHELRSWDQESVREVNGVLTARPAVAAARGAYWSPTIRSAATLLAMSVQQRIVPVDHLGVAVERLPRRSRRKEMLLLIDDLKGGCQSLSEIDFARECRKRGLPEPDRQQLLQRPSGRWYLDVRWSRFGLAVEIDGIHHSGAAQTLNDRLKQNEVTLSGERLLHIPNFAVSAGDERFFAQIRNALIQLGWRP